jgi:hypothetical protein
MNVLDTAAVLLAIAATCGYLNHRLLPRQNQSFG